MPATKPRNDQNPRMKTDDKNRPIGDIDIGIIWLGLKNICNLICSQNYIRRWRICQRLETILKTKLENIELKNTGSTI